MMPPLGIKAETTIFDENSQYDLSKKGPISTCWYYYLM